ncbi:Smr/MutS family protein [Persicitalea jodogahamensis]|uniref:Smr domain-containing protein n=1 Tax=Persicitalea jodogahamensis TaxID=402147 RepID=A0A8J3G8Y7_9BACT|nr:DUF2027 domain-containing protein [Persicitalea jodogahamensis]GHB58838.1 hypothetical protein GCM10007390_10530 [Persicitalea jodogahamensis]
MNIGDKVRLLRDKEEGIVYAFLPGNIVEIEIEEGFRIPVLRSEVVSVSPMESQRLKPAESAGGSFARKQEEFPTFSRKAPFAEKGIYMAFVPVNDLELTVHLINNSDWALPFTVYQDSAGRQAGLASGVLSPRTNQRLTDLLTKDIEQWPIFEVQALYFREGSSDIKPPFHKRLRCRVQSFYKKKQQVPVLAKEGYVYQLDEENVAGPVTPDVPPKPSSVTASELRERMLSPESTTSHKVETPQAVVDLHLEKLSPIPDAVSNADKLKLQLATFERQLENAIAAGLDEITFIHGAGSGVLRQEIHRRLSQHKNVQFFEDAQKEKFGYGATFAKIK